MNLNSKYLPGTPDRSAKRRVERIVAGGSRSERSEARSGEHHRYRPDNPAEADSYEAHPRRHRTADYVRLERLGAPQAAIPSRLEAAEPSSRRAVRDLINGVAAGRLREVSPDLSHTASHKLAEKQLMNLLLWRQKPQISSLESLVKAPVERLLESYVADRFLSHAPQATRQVLEKIASRLVKQLRLMSAEDQKEVYRCLKKIIREDGEEFWRKKDNIKKLIRDENNVYELNEIVFDYLCDSFSSKVKIASGLILMRDLIRAIHAAKSDTLIVEAMSRAEAYYLSVICPTKPKYLAENTGSEPVASHQQVVSSGILSLDQRSDDLYEEWMRPVPRPHSLKKIDLDDPHVQTCLRSGNPVITGLSGTTNIFLFVVPSLCKNFNEVARDHLLAALTCAMIYAGGHSINEVLEVAHGLSEPAYLELANFGGEARLEPSQAYKRAQARFLFAAILRRVDRPEIFNDALQDVLGHYDERASKCGLSSDSSDGLELVVRKKSDKGREKRPLLDSKHSGRHPFDSRKSA